MATLSLSPTPAPLSVCAMSTSRRAPLSANPNAANSPLRGSAAAAAALAKQQQLQQQRRSYANVQREEAYGHHPPPSKKQMLDAVGRSAASSRSQSLQQSRAGSTATSARAPLRDRAPVVQRAAAAAVLERHDEKDRDRDDVEAWTRHHRARFPKIVFYFESVPDDVRAKLAKQVASLGAVRSICAPSYSRPAC